MTRLGRPVVHLLANVAHLVDQSVSLGIARHKLPVRHALDPGLNVHVLLEIVDADSITDRLGDFLPAGAVHRTHYVSDRHGIAVEAAQACRDGRRR